MIDRRWIAAALMATALAQGGPAFAQVPETKSDFGLAEAFSPVLLAVARIVFTPAEAAPADATLFVPRAMGEPPPALRPALRPSPPPGAPEGPLGLRGRH